MTRCSLVPLGKYQSPRWLLPSARMRSVGTVVVSVCVCVCVSVTLNLTCRMFFRLTNDTTYLTGNKGQTFRTVFSENAPLQS